MSWGDEKQQVFMQVAQRIAMLGTCDRKQVGAVIIRDGRCISWGYNGAPPGLPHCAESWHGWQTPVLDELEAQYPGFRNTRDPDDPRQEEMYLMYLEAVEGKISTQGCRNATHAEANALAFAARQGISTDGCTLFVTVSPCEVCARLLIAAGIERVYYHERYRDHSGEQLLEKALVPCRMI